MDDDDDDDEEMSLRRTLKSRRDNIVDSLEEIPLGESSQLGGSIRKVRSCLKGNIDTNIITPKLVSIGPYHHVTQPTLRSKAPTNGTACLQEMERAKRRYLEDLTQRAQCNNYLENCVEIILQHEDEARGEYPDLSHEITSDDFVRVMVLDGCFIVEFLLKWYLNDRKSQVSSIRTKLAVFKNDLLLMENQIPYFILEEFYKITKIPDLTKSSVSFTQIALTFIMGDLKAAQFTAEMFNKERVEFDHLLHLYHRTLKSYGRRNCMSRVNSLLLKISNAMLSPAVWMLIKLFTRSKRPSLVPPGVPNASDLRDAGFGFHKKHEMDYNFMDISGHGRNIKIPVLRVNESLLTNFQNLIAFENCLSRYGKDFTAYAMLLDYLMDSAEDVAILKACGIIDNRLGDDRKVADFFNNLCSGFDPDDEEHYLSGLFENVSSYYTESHYKVSFFWWRKKYVPDYFTNPWAIPSMIAASILLALTFAQTIYTIYPYYHPRSSG